MEIEEKPKCGICGSDMVATIKNVGWDIDESGEENQHIDKCLCGAWRFNIDRWNNFQERAKYYGKWNPKTEWCPI